METIEALLSLSSPEFETNLSQVVDHMINSGNISNFGSIATQFMSTTWQRHGKLAMTTLSSSISKGIYGDELIELSEQILESIKNHHHSPPFDEADHILREALFEAYISNGDYSSAAQILSLVNMESNTRPFTDEEKANIWIKCAEASLADEECAAAEAYLNKASSIMGSIKEKQLVMRYKVTYAKVLDMNKKFSEAALKYYEISIIDDISIDQNDLLSLLGNAITCAILAKAGPRRSRIMGLVCKDNRTQALTNAPILLKMHRAELLKSDELKEFEDSLQSHQKAIVSGGRTILGQAIMEHNMIAAARLYDNISLNELGDLLGLDADVSENLAAKMIAEGRLQASIDQIENIIEFQDNAKDSPLLSWDKRIDNVCNLVRDAVLMVETVPKA